MVCHCSPVVTVCPDTGTRCLSTHTHSDWCIVLRCTVGWHLTSHAPLHWLCLLALYFSFSFSVHCVNRFDPSIHCFSPSLSLRLLFTHSGGCVFWLYKINCLTSVAVVHFVEGAPFYWHRLHIASNVCKLIFFFFNRTFFHFLCRNPLQLVPDLSRITHQLSCCFWPSRRQMSPSIDISASQTVLDWRIFPPRPCTCQYTLSSPCSLRRQQTRLSFVNLWLKSALFSLSISHHYYLTTITIVFMLIISITPAITH